MEEVPVLDGLRDPTSTKLGLGCVPKTVWQLTIRRAPSFVLRQRPDTKPK